MITTGGFIAGAGLLLYIIGFIVHVINVAAIAGRPPKPYIFRTVVGPIILLISRVAIWVGVIVAVIGIVLYFL